MSRVQLPHLPEPRVPHFDRAQTHRLSNGVEVYVVERHELPVVDVRVVVRGGAAADGALQAGRAWMVAELLDQGAGTRDALAIADEVDFLGASIECRASWDFMSAGLHVLVPRLDAALDLLADIVLRPTFPSVELERKRQERFAAILRERDDPRSLATHTFTRLAYGVDHPYGHPIGGTRESIERLTLDDVHACHAARFTADRAFIVVAGDVTPSNLLSVLEERFGRWASSSRRSAATTPAAGTLTQSPAALHIVDRPAAPQSELRVGLAGPPRSTPDYYALLVANTVLGGSFTSRLNLRLREEKAYTYGASSGFSFRRDGGPFLAATAVGTAATADAINDIVREIERLTQEPIPPDELERAKNYIVFGLPRRFETTADIAEQVTDLALFDLGEDYFERFGDRIRGITAIDARDAASRWLDPNGLTLVIAGDAAATRDELESLGFGPVRERTGD